RDHLVPLAVESEMECAADRRNVLIEPLADLVDLEDAERARLRHEHRLEEFRPPAILLAIGEKEGLERDVPRARPSTQPQLGVRPDGRRRHVADGRAIGDVATDGAQVADLNGSEPPDQLEHAGIKLAERGLGALISDGRSEPQSFRAVRDALELADLAQ